MSVYYQHIVIITVNEILSFILSFISQNLKRSATANTFLFEVPVIYRAYTCTLACQSVHHI